VTNEAGVQSTCLTSEDDGFYELDLRKRLCGYFKNKKQRQKNVKLVVERAYGSNIFLKTS